MLKVSVPWYTEEYLNHILANADDAGFHNVQERVGIAGRNVLIDIVSRDDAGLRRYLEAEQVLGLEFLPSHLAGPAMH